MTPELTPDFSIKNLLWSPAGPPEDRDTHLTTPIRMSGVPMILHAVEVFVDREERVVPKSMHAESLIFAVEIMANSASDLHRCLMLGKCYLVFALPSRI